MSRIFNKNIPSLEPKKCNICGKILSRKYILEEHIRDMHGFDRKISCTIQGCNYKTNRVGNYNLHLKTRHNICLPVISCYAKGCGKKSKNETSLIKHMLKCSGKPVFNCIECPVLNCKDKFLTKSGLESHLKIKHNSQCLPKNAENAENTEKFYNEVNELLIF